MHFYEVVGNLHMHTVYSDGSGTHREVAQAAAAAGLDFVVTTDHNVWVDGVEGYYDGILVLVGEEIHHVRRESQGSHLLVYGAEAELAHLAPDPQKLIAAVGRRQGICFLAHPFEKRSPISPDLEAIPWDDWDVSGYAGIEIWNTMSEFKGLARNKLAALLFAYMPSLGIKGPFRGTLSLWDHLLNSGVRASAIGGADAHAGTYTMGPLRRVVFPYQDLFSWVNTHVLLDRPLRDDLEGDKRLIYDALSLGHTWVGYDRAASTRGFMFQARSGSNQAIMGEELPRAAAAIIEVKVPQRGQIRLLRNGRLEARVTGTEMRYTTAEPGIYRVEVLRRFRGLNRGWIYSSPIYIR